MKHLSIVVAFALICAVVGAKDDEHCHDNAVTACASNFVGTSLCTSRYGGIDHIEKHVQAYINERFQKSYEYLLMATHFNSYQKNRPGFRDLYQGLSDKSFDDTIALIKHLTHRGGQIDFTARHKNVPNKPFALELDELHSLARALDNERQLASGGVDIHSLATHATKRDPEFAHYLEEELLPGHTDQVRTLAGHANDLTKLLKVNDPSLSVYLFDQYLQKK